MRIHVLQHVPFEGLGSIEGWALERGASITWTRFHEPLPGAWRAELAAAGVDLLIALGGPMSVNDEEELPWLVEEKLFLREAIERGTPVLGICLGAQLIASALGARVYPGVEKEIGWFPIEGVAGHTGPTMSPEVTSGAAHLSDVADASSPRASANTFAFPAHATVFHWHGETFDLPPGAVRLASSPVTPNQAFRVGKRAIGLQFHLETTPESMEALVANCGDELIPGSFIQSDQEMRGVAPERFDAIHLLMSDLLDDLVSA
jgi:GMP synthase-like glutamine amidotransferase